MADLTQEVERLLQTASRLSQRVADYEDPFWCQEIADLSGKMCDAY